MKGVTEVFSEELKVKEISIFFVVVGCFANLLDHVLLFTESEQMSVVGSIL